ncbi:MAG: polysaccharide biosynthesis tyrosine autokinase [Armatimonadetes bacterium]|nr:polysaccharide biosynthesis tyrosine autokinase [Armatimonadota bacterium]MDW8029847.1 polysaccharide biosynthesis tyrosine autokinase [Armatimonadota bacterium]
MQQQQRVLVRPEQKAFDWGFYLWVFYRRLPLIIVLTALALIAAGVYAYTSPKFYEAVSLVRLRKQVPPGLFPQAGQQSQSDTLDLKTATQLVMTFLTTQEALKIIQEQKLGSMRVSPAVRQYLSLLSAQEILTFISADSYEPDLIRISVKHTLPEVAAALANGIAEAFVARLNREARAEATNERRFIETQLQAVRNELQRLDKQIAEVKQQLNMVDVSEETRALVSSIRTYTAELLMAETELRGAMKAREQLQQMLAREQPFTPMRKENPVLAEMEKRLAELEAQRTQLLNRYLPNHPTIKRLDDQIEALRKEIARRQNERVVEVPDATPNPRYATLYQQILDAERKRMELEERKKALSVLLQQTQQQLRRFPEQQRRLGDLTRQLQVLEQAYMSLLSRLQDAQIREAARLGNATIADVAVVPTKPVGPDLLRLLALAFLGGLGLSIGLTFLLEFMKTSVTSSDELKHILGVPVLSVVPEAKLGSENDSLIRLMNSRRGAAEAIRTLRSNLRFLIMRQSNDGNMRAFLITSAIKGEGKSFISAALSIAFAQTGRRVVVVDADMRKPDLYKYFGVDESIGLANVLRDTASLDQALKETQVPNLHLLPAGVLPKGSDSITPAELFSSEAMQHLLQRLKERFDLVLIDSPPIMAVTDPSILAPMVDGVLFVVELGHVTKTAVQEVKEQLELAQAKILGVVINKASRKRGYDYYRDYYYYHGYYEREP